MELFYPDVKAWTQADGEKLSAYLCVASVKQNHGKSATP